MGVGDLGTLGIVVPGLVVGVGVGLPLIVGVVIGLMGVVGASTKGRGVGRIGIVIKGWMVGVVGVVVRVGAVVMGIVVVRGGLERAKRVSLSLTCRLSFWATRLRVSFSAWTVWTVLCRFSRGFPLRHRRLLLGEILDSRSRLLGRVVSTRVWQRVTSLLARCPMLIDRRCSVVSRVSVVVLLRVLRVLETRNRQSWLAMFVTWWIILVLTPVAMLV